MNTPNTKPTGINTFGGKNEHSLYVPLTEDEQEVLYRIVESKDLEIVVKGWGVVRNPLVTFGDKRISLIFRLDFNAPATPKTVHFFDLELKTLAGIVLMRQRYPLNPPTGVQIGAGIFLEMAWDIAIDHMSPELVKLIKPGAIGLTSRRLDKDTGNRTVTGNMDPTPNQERLLNFMDKRAAKIAEEDKTKVIEATKASGFEVKVDGKKIIAPEVI
jgi:hypothetical protein